MAKWDPQYLKSLTVSPNFSEDTLDNGISGAPPLLEPMEPIASSSVFNDPTRLRMGLGQPNTMRSMGSSGYRFPTLQEMREMPGTDGRSFFQPSTNRIRGGFEQEEGTQMYTKPEIHAPPKDFRVTKDNPAKPLYDEPPEGSLIKDSPGTLNAGLGKGVDPDAIAEQPVGDPPTITDEGGTYFDQVAFREAQVNAGTSGEEMSLNPKGPLFTTNPNEVPPSVISTENFDSESTVEDLGGAPYMSMHPQEEVEDEPTVIDESASAATAEGTAESGMGILSSAEAGPVGILGGLASAGENMIHNSIMSNERADVETNVAYMRSPQSGYHIGNDQQITNYLATQNKMTSMIDTIHGISSFIGGFGGGLISDIGTLGIFGSPSSMAGYGQNNSPNIADNSGNLVDPSVSDPSAIAAQP